MRSRRRPSSFASKRTLALAAAALLFAALFVTHRAVPGGIVRLVHAAGAPLWETGGLVRREVGGLLALFGPKGELAHENRELREVNERLVRALLDYGLIASENERLRSLLDRAEESERVPAVVLLHPNAAPYDTLVIDVGARAGVAVGSRVFASLRTYLGAVEEVHAGTSRVRLLSSSGEEALVVLEESNVELIATGRGGGNLTLSVPRGVSVAVGERVLVPGIPAALVGTVATVRSDPADAFQEVYVRLPVNTYTIREVFVAP